MDKLISAFATQKFCSFWKTISPRILHSKSQTSHQLLSITSSLNVCSEFVSSVKRYLRRVLSFWGKTVNTDVSRHSTIETIYSNAKRCTCLQWTVLFNVSGTQPWCRTFTVWCRWWHLFSLHMLKWGAKLHFLFVCCLLTTLCAKVLPHHIFFTHILSTKSIYPGITREDCHI